jgi:hypothetical protein
MIERVARMIASGKRLKLVVILSSDLRVDEIVF